LAQEDTVTAAQLAAASRVLSNPNRLRIYQVIVDHRRRHGQADRTMVQAGCAFAGFMQRLNIGASTLSYHVRELSVTGLIRVERENRRRFCHAESIMQSRLAHF
jgi:predicted transcriptional regulator